jgi:enoyl-[acyl-carrier-protein] reductase (NADH)
LLKGSNSNKSYIDEVKSILKEAGKQIKDWDKVLKKENEKESNQLLLPDDFVPLSDVNKSKLWKKCFDYAVKRNFTTVDILKHNMGYVKSGQLVDRLIIPSYDRDGVLNYYTARSYFDDAYFEIDNTTEIQFVGGLPGTNSDRNWSIVCSTFMVSKSNLNIEERIK